MKSRYLRRRMMGIIYDMANGRFQSPPVHDVTEHAHNECVHGPAVRTQEASPAGLKARPDARTIHLIRALLRSR
jgi:hypothetical protein